MWVNHVIQPRSCITREDSTISQSLLNKIVRVSKLYSRNASSWKALVGNKMMLSSIKGLTGFRFEISKLSHSFGLSLRSFFLLFVRILVHSALIRLHAQFLCCMHAQAWYRLSRYQAAADPCITSRGPGVFHLLGVPRLQT